MKMQLEQRHHLPGDNQLIDDYIHFDVKHLPGDNQLIDDYIHFDMKHLENDCICCVSV